MTLAELEDEIRDSLVHVLSASDQPKEVQAQEVQLATYYLSEVLKRWRARGITRVRVRQKALRAMKRRLREEGAQQLKQLVEGVTYDKETKAADHSGAAPTAEGPGGGAGQVPQADPPPKASPGGRQDVVQPDRERPADANDEPGPRADIAPPPEVGESFSTTGGGRISRIYTVCKRCGRIQGNLHPDAVRKYTEQCGECPR